MRSLSIRTGVVVAALALTAAACGDDNGTTSPPDTSPPTSSTTSSTTTAAPTTEAPTTTAPPTTTTVPRPEIPPPPASTVEGVLGLGRPVVIAHAGGDQSWPHSTMYAYTQAALAGVDVLEMDVQLTGDGVLVVQHDDTVDRTTQATGRVRDMTYDELQALDNGYWASGEWSNHDLPPEDYVYRGIRTGDAPPPPGFGPDDFRVETWRSIATSFPDHVLDIEIKIPRDDNGDDDLDFAIAGARELANEIEELGRTDSVVVVSFNDDVMAAFHEFAPDVATSPGTDAMTAWGFAGGELLPSDRILQVPPMFGDLDVLRLPGLLDRARAEGYAIWVWPNSADQENPDFYASLVDEFAIDGIIAGHPEQAVERYRAEGWMP